MYLYKKEDYMNIGVPKEIKSQEFRVGLTPAGVHELISHQHKVFVEHNAGLGAGILDEEYIQAGATILNSAKEVFDSAEMIVKVKEPQPDECKLLKPKQILFTYLHLAADKLQTELLLESKASAIAYETITDKNGTLPLLAPMSEVAGRLSIQAGMISLQAHNGGAGILLSGVPGVPAGHVLIIGGGVVGTNATKIALGIGASVSIIDRSIPRLCQLDDIFQGRVKTIYSSEANLEKELEKANLVVGAVLIPGASAPKIVKKKHLSLMQKGSVLVDVAIDQGGCFETSHPTNYENPTFIVDDIVHYCVANMPGKVPQTSTYALTNATLTYVVKLANKGLQALKDDPYFLQGLNVHEGKLTNAPVSEALGMPYTPIEKVL